MIRKNKLHLIIRLSNHPYILSFLAGLCATLTLPPIYAFPLVVPAYGGLFWLLARAQTRRQSALCGFFWGWGFYISGLYWFVIALMTDPDKFAWLIPFALFALTAVIALYQAVFGALYFHVRRQEIAGAFLFAALWTLVEYARGHLFTGFPWNFAGYAFAASDASIQLGSVFGIYGLTFITVLVGALCVAYRKAGAVALALLALGIGWGYQRAQDAPHEFVQGVTLRLVQANIQQHHKWNPARQFEGMRMHAELTESPGIENITHVIWPETAVPYLMHDQSTLTARLGELLRPGQYLITGTLRGEDERVTNSIAMLDTKGDIVGQYDKAKLVPFGEFLPLRWLIPDALETPVGMADLAPGSGPQTLNWPNLPPVSPLICYEVIFPGYVNSGARPGWLLSVTNDAWFGTSSAPYQHLAMARMRAVEQGLPMVRVANTGITAVYDAYGREVARIPLNKQGFVDVGLPVSSHNGTIYARITY